MQIEILGTPRITESENQVTIIGVTIGILFFLALGYLCLMVLIIPYLWFAAFLKSEEAQENERREKFRKSKGELSSEGISVDWISDFKNVNKNGIRKFTENEYVEVSLEWLLTWGVFLTLEGFWAYSLYNGFVFIMTNVGDFLESWFYSG